MYNLTFTFTCCLGLFLLSLNFNIIAKLFIKKYIYTYLYTHSWLIRNNIIVPDLTVILPSIIILLIIFSRKKSQERRLENFHLSWKNKILFRSILTISKLAKFILKYQEQKRMKIQLTRILVFQGIPKVFTLLHQALIIKN